MRTPRRTIRAVGLSLALTAAVLTAASGCSGTPVGARTSPSPQPTAPTSLPADSIPAVHIPPDGANLASFGFQNGPRQAFSVPRDAFLTASTDQAGLVTLAFAAPAPSEVYEYLVMTLPKTGFRIQARRAGPDTPALVFSGWGWTGHFTGRGSTSAVTLRPTG